MNSIIPSLRNYLSGNIDIKNIGLLGLPGAIDRGNFTMIVIDQKLGPKYIVKVCRVKNNEKFRDEFSLVNELYNYNTYFTESLARPVANTFVDDQNVMVTEYISGSVMLPIITIDEIPKNSIAKKHYKLVEEFLINYYTFLTVTDKIKYISVNIKHKIDLLKKYFSYSLHELSIVETTLCSKYLYATQHGDFTRHNILENKKGISIIDWTDTGVKIITDDIFYFIINYYLQLRSETGIIGIINTFNSSFYKKNDYSNLINEFIKKIFKILNIHNKVSDYLILFLVDRCIEEAQKLENIQHTNLNNFTKNIFKQNKFDNIYDTIIWSHLLKYILKK